ncbi:MAG: O-antigen ligase family protein [Bacteroidales bacterium]|nr:O-antigen ligase family protein [Bacteroidales bacterium]
MFEDFNKVIGEIRHNSLSEKAKLYLVYFTSGLFIVLNSFLIYKEFFWGAVIPAFIIIALFFIFALDKVLLLIVFLTPLSINLLDKELNIGISLPAEPLMFGLLVIFVIKVLFDFKYDRQVLHHPVTIAIIFNLIWIFLTSVTSQIPLVSFKFFLSRLWFVVPMFFVALMLLKNYRNINKLFWYYAIALAIVIIYTTYRHYINGFAEKTGTWVMKPFYNDHTAYGAVMALFIPVFVGLIINPVQKGWARIAALFMVAMMVMALILSFSRAAWISLAVGTFVFAIALFKIRLRWVALTGILLFGILYTFKFEIFDYLAKNKQDSSANFVEHVQSIANISSDASNLERINRWQSAIRMFNEKPILGWGPGTYQFAYAPFQQSKERTIISTNFGDVGNAHSEYIGPMAESGILGMITFVLIMLTTLYTGFKVYRQSQLREVRLLSLSVTIGLITYFAHGVLNNFLDTDKLSIPFWGFIAVLVALDLYHKDHLKQAKDTGLKPSANF